MKILEIHPAKISLYADITIVYLHLKDPASAWQTLDRAWHLAPTSYYTLLGMTFYFLQIGNFVMAEKACRLLLEVAPQDLTALGFMAEAMLGQERFEEAIKIGAPVVELASILGELPPQMGVSLVKRMADYLQQKKDFTGAARLWESGAKCQPGDISVMLDWIRALQLNREQARARQVLLQASALSPQNPEVLRLLRQLPAPKNAKYKEHRR
jgi:hypothetical protein